VDTQEYAISIPATTHLPAAEMAPQRNPGHADGVSWILQTSDSVFHPA